MDQPLSTDLTGSWETSKKTIRLIETQKTQAYFLKTFLRIDCRNLTAPREYTRTGPGLTNYVGCLSKGTLMKGETSWNKAS